jgi:hypothetical protein
LETADKLRMRHEQVINRGTACEGNRNWSAHVIRKDQNTFVSLHWWQKLNRLGRRWAVNPRDFIINRGTRDWSWISNVHMSDDTIQDVTPATSFIHIGRDSGPSTV